MTASHAVETAKPAASAVASTRPLRLQHSLAIGRTDDPLEHEADRVAREILRERSPAGTVRRCACGGTPEPGGECAECRAKRLGLQRASAQAGSQAAAPPIVHDVLARPGRALSARTRSVFEPRLGVDLADVRVHDDPLAARSAEAVGAHAYTVGTHIAFGAGRYAPGTGDGDRLVAHELVHVLQQRTGSPSLARQDDQGAPGTVTVQHCDPTQVPLVVAAIDAARRWMNDVEPKVNAFVFGGGSPTDAAVVQAALEANFHTASVPWVVTIAEGFAQLRNALNGQVTYQCASEYWCDPDDVAYVRGNDVWVKRWWDINLCPLWFNCTNPEKKIDTIIHEKAHQYPGVTDKAYEDEGDYKTLSIADAMNNADSYAVTVRQIFHGGARGPGEKC